MVLQCCYVRNTTRVSNFLFFLLQERYYQLVILAFLYLTGNYCVSLALCVLMVCAYRCLKAFRIRCFFLGITVQAQVQVLPEGIEAVNGSTTDMGCTSALVDSGGVMTCNSQSYLVDGCSPDINTSISDWASQLVTVRRNEGTDAVSFAHVLLTFGFDTAVSLTGIEIDLFHCPDWDIGAPRITVYVNEEYNLTFRFGLSFTLAVQPSQSSCDSLTTVRITGDTLSVSSHRTFHILVDLSHHSSIQWVHIGEVRFLSEGGVQATGTCLPTPLPRSSSTSLPSSSPSPSASLPPSSSTYLSTTSSAPPRRNSSTLHFSMPSDVVATSQIEKSSSHSITKHLKPTGISKSPTPGGTTTSPELSASGETLMIILVVVIVGLTLLACVLAGLIVFCCLRRHFCSTEAHYTVKTLSYELEKSADLPGSIDAQLEATNPMHTSSAEDVSRYVCPDASLGTNNSDDHYDLIRGELIYPANEGYYDVVARDEPLPPTVPTLTGFPDDEDEFDAGHYELIGRTARTAVSNAKNEPNVREGQSSNAQPNTPAASEASALPAVYSTVQVRAPKVPEKNADLKNYLAVHIPFNENIYSESINPSDFIAQQPEPEGESQCNPLIYAPIYPPFTVLPESFEIPAEVNDRNIKEKFTLRTGHYGEVVLADTVGLSLKDMHLSKTETNKDVSITVAVKRLKLDATPAQRRAFETEAKFLSRLRHPNVVRLLGASYEDPAFIMMEYMKEGDLSLFLKKYSEVVSMAAPSSKLQITESTLVYMASQIASGMKHLAGLNFIHRDLATRNCLISKNFSVKVASLGVGRDIYQSHYFRVQGKTLLPIRWMATECFDGKFSEKSDVWAFGVTMWELFTLAKQLPYRHLSDEEVIHNALKREHRQFPPQPRSCPQSVYEIMERCWVVDLNERITFRELYTLLQTAL